MRLSKTEWAVIALTLLGALLRFWNIGFQMMNYDEEFTIEFARPALSIVQIIITSLTTDCNPPLYYISAHLSMLVFGMTATAIRIPSAIFGALLIPVMYYIGKEYKDELFGLLMAGYSFLFYNFFFYSRFGRSYSLCLLLFALAFLFFMRAVKGDKRAGIFFGIFAVCAVWSHLYSCIPIGIMILYLLWERRDFISTGIVALGCVPLLNFIYLIVFGRSVANGTAFGFTPSQVLYLTAPDIFGYSAFVTVPIILYVLWTRRSDPILNRIAVISAATVASMVVLSTITPVMMHYSVFLVPLLFIPLILPFYDAIMENQVAFVHLCVIMVILILEVVQIVAFNIYQRGSF
jgi:4-amino-4-deoxy-L-arabinose transferase-like glycosyltransferase